MRKTFYTSFSLGKPGAPPSLDDALDACASWARTPRAGVDPSLLRDLKFDLPGRQEYSIGENASLTILRHEVDNDRRCAIRLEHPHSEDPTALWRVEVCLSEIKTEGALKFSVTTMLGRKKETITPLGTPLSRPKLVVDLVGRFGAFEGAYPISRSHLLLDTNGVSTFLKVLTNPQRTLPVVLISAKNEDDKPIAPPSTVANQLVGLAHVYACKDRFPAFKLTDTAGKWNSCWNGAVRLYWPGFTLASSPHDHRIIHRERVALLGNDIATELLSTISKMAVARSSPPEVSWDGIEAAISSSKINELRKAGEKAEFLALYEEETARLDRQVKDLELRLEQAQKEAEKSRREAESWRVAYEEARSGSTPTEDTPPPSPRSVSEAIDRIEQEFHGKIAFPLNNKSDRESPFEDVDAFYAALRFLATTYYQAKIGSVPCADLPKACLEASQFSYKPHQAETTMGQFSNYYHATYQGKKVPLEEHLAHGSDKDPRYAIRVGFFFDASQRVIVVGFIGQHQRTRAT